MRLGLTLLIVAGALTALFVSAARTPSSRTGARLEIVVRKVPFSCKHPPAVDLPDCTQFRQEIKALKKALRNGEPPSGPYLVLKPSTLKSASSSP